MKIQLKRSNQLESGEAKEPTLEFMEYGELAVNYNSEDPAIFIKTTDGAGGDAIVRIADTSDTDIPALPNASETVKGIVELATAAETSAGSDRTRAVHPFGFNSALTSALIPYAKLNSPAFTGVPTAPTAPVGTNNTQLATTAFVQSAVSSSGGGGGSTPPNASETVIGIVRLANFSETSAGSSRTLAVNPANLNSILANYLTSSNLSAYALKTEVLWHYTGGYLQPKNNTYQIYNNGSILLGPNSADPDMLLGRQGTFKCTNDIQCMGNSGLSINTPIDSVGYGANFYKAQVGATNTGFARNIQIVSGYNTNSFGGKIGATIWGVGSDMCMIGAGGDSGQPYSTTVHNNNGSFRMGTTPLTTYTGPPIAIYNTGTAYFTGQLNYGSINQISDSRFKRDISTAGSQLADVAALGKLLKNFYYTDEAPVNDEVRATRRLGLLAQEAEIISPSLVKTEIREGRKESPGTPALIGTRIDEVTGEEVEAVLCHAGFEITNTEIKSISTDALVFKLLGAISELNDKVAQLESNSNYS